MASKLSARIKRLEKAAKARKVITYADITMGKVTDEELWADPIWRKLMEETAECFGYDPPTAEGINTDSPRSES